MPEHTDQRPKEGEPQPSAMSQVVYRNIGSLIEMRERERRQSTRSEKVADAITAFAGSMAFVYVHALVYGGWLVVNGGIVPAIRPWDPFPFVMLAMIASVEAIFLSTFILISQNRMQRAADRRAELDLQISLLTEHELTQAIRMVDEIAKRLQTPRPPEEEVQAIRQDVMPQKVVEEIENAERTQRFSDK